MNSGIGEDLLHAITGATEGVNNVVDLGAIRLIFRSAKADSPKYFLNLTRRIGVAVRKFYAQRFQEWGHAVRLEAPRARASGGFIKFP